MSGDTRLFADEPDERTRQVSEFGISCYIANYREVETVTRCTLKNNNLVFLPRLAVMIAVFAMLQYVPLHGKVQATRAGKSAQLSADTKTDELIKKLPQLRSQLERTQAAIGDYEAKIPADTKAWRVPAGNRRDVMNTASISLIRWYSPTARSKWIT